MPWRSDFIVDLYPSTALPDFITSARRALMFSEVFFFFCGGGGVRARRLWAARIEAPAAVWTARFGRGRRERRGRAAGAAGVAGGLGRLPW